MTDTLTRTGTGTGTGTFSDLSRDESIERAQGDTTYATRDEQAVSTADFASADSDTGAIARTEARTPSTRGQTSDDSEAPLFPTGEAEGLRTKWDSVQAGFVDEPRRAVEDADALVAGAMKRLAETFAKEREKLEGQWDRDGEASTEDLRLALKRYRAFFGRLLAI